MASVRATYSFQVIIREYCRHIPAFISTYCAMIYAVVHGTHVRYPKVYICRVYLVSHVTHDFQTPQSWWLNRASSNMSSSRYPLGALLYIHKVTPTAVSLSGDKNFFTFIHNLDFPPGDTTASRVLRILWSPYLITHAYEVMHRLSHTWVFSFFFFLFL